MRITQVDLWHVGVPAPAPFYPSWIPGFPQTENRFTLVRIRTQSGLEGWSAGPAMGRERHACERASLSKIVCQSSWRTGIPGRVLASSTGFKSYIRIASMKRVRVDTPRTQ